MRQTFPKTITSDAFVAGNTLRAKGRDLPLKMGDRLVYHRGWLIEVDLDPTFTTNPGIVGHNNALSKINWKWGGQERYSLSGNGARMFERHEQGKHSAAEAIQTTSTNNRYFARYIPNGPRNFACPDDFDTCAGNLGDAELEVKLGALLDISADTTAAGGTVRLTAILTLADDIHIAPWFERREETAGSGVTLEGECLLAEVFLCNSTTYDAIAAADFSGVKLETGLMNVPDGEDAELLTRKYQQEWAVGQLDSIQGEPRDATFDVNQRQVNLVTPTAIAVQSADLQTVLSYNPGQKITGLMAYVRKNFKVSWTGANGAATVRLVGRFLPLEDEAVGKMAEEASRVCGVTVITDSARVKTVSRGNPGPMSRFMRRTVKVVRKAA